jgi:hypothetical protein
MPRSRPVKDEIDRYIESLQSRGRGQKRAGFLFVLLLLEILTIYLVKNDSGLLEEIADPIRAMIPADIFSEAKAVAQGCDASLPANGEIQTFNPFPFGSGSAKLEITNHHAYPVVLQINSTDQNIQYQAISVHPKATVPIANVPAGSYGMTILVGNVWCSMEKGFSDGEKIPTKKLLEIRADTNQTLVFTSRGTKPSEFYLVSMASPTAGPVQGQPPAAGNAPAAGTGTATGTGAPQETEQQKRDRCYAAYTRVRDQIHAQMRQQHTVQQAQQFAEQLRKNEQAYVECRR